MKEKVALISILANIFLTVSKLIVGFATGSSAVFAEGLHSGMDILSSAISFIGIKIAKKPIDKKHPYGYYKFEVMAGLAITVILFLTGLLIEDGYEKFFVNHFHADRNGVAPGRFYEDLSAENAARFELIEEYYEKDKVDETVALIAAREKAIREDGLGTGYFVYMHFNATHFPWKHPHGDNLYDGYKIFGERQEDLYDEAMLYTDITLRNFFGELKKMHVYDKAVIVVTADHGSGLDDHGHFGGFYCYEEQLHVPLLIKLPASAGLKPRRISTPVSGLDLAPTFVNLMRRSGENPYQGVSLLPLMADPAATIDREYIFSISSFHQTSRPSFMGTSVFVRL